MAFTMAEAKKSDTFSALGCFVLIVVGLASIGALRNYFLGEEEGQVKYEDCRNKITVQEDSSDTWFKKFTCSYAKTQSGKIMSGVCVHVETEGPVCQTAYIYYKKPQIVCSDPKFPNAGYDDLCHSN
jgi:hypothetical protein